MGSGLWPSGIFPTPGATSPAFPDIYDILILAKFRLIHFTLYR